MAEGGTELTFRALLRKWEQRVIQQEIPHNRHQISADGNLAQELQRRFDREPVREIPRRPLPAIPERRRIQIVVTRPPNRYRARPSRESSSDYEELHALAERLGPAQPPGLRKKDIDMLPTRRFEPNNAPKGSSATATCHICLNKWKRGDSIKSLPCFHDFHEKCIDEWLKIKKSCPICRLEVKFRSH